MMNQNIARHDHLASHDLTCGSLIENLGCLFRCLTVKDLVDV
jgi:hypothetical protein